MKKKKSLTGSFACKLIAYILLAVSVCVGLLALVGTVFLVEEDVYSYSQVGWLEDYFADRLHSDADYILEMLQNSEWEHMQDFCEHSNLDVVITREFEETAKTVWSDYMGGYDTPFAYSFVWEDPDADIGNHYTVKMYINPDFPETDDYSRLYSVANLLYTWRIAIPIVAGVCVFLALFCFIFLMCSAGHKNGMDGIVPSVLHPIPLDIVTILFAVVALFGVFVCIEGAWYYFDSYVLSISVFLLTVTLAAVWVAMYCMELATRMKLGTWWRNTVVYGVLSLLMLMLRGIGHGILTVVRGIPMAVDALILFIGISAIEFICLNWWSEDAGVVLAWFLEKLIFLPLLIYLVVILRRLQQGSKALAEGNLGYRVDDKGMFLGFKDHAANLNAIRNGMGIALEERMKSEHLKTELITNVSHDIKTPLTSIINYADLLGNTVMTTQPGQQLDKERVVEYTEVLLRQSRRMKKLLEDLVEVSKATTGNLEVTMTPCEIGVLLSQAVGEYEQRFEQQQLHLIVTQPDTPVQIMADGRHLWRIFDNLLNNICKYAQENSRVYVNVEADAGQVEITFRNMSKYVLNVTGKELEERFVRGDKSRHMEGSGLGLSIAKSLMDLQNGRMEIVTDGDLFKVILQFAQLQE